MGRASDRKAPCMPVKWQKNPELVLHNQVSARRLNRKAMSRKHDRARSNGANFDDHGND
jgi:hypothetical protein